MYANVHRCVIIAKEAYQIDELTDSAADLIANFKQNSTSLCIAGSTIQDMNVRELTTSLRKIEKGAKVIVVNHSSGLKHLDAALKAGVNGYITRYTSAAELLSTVSEVQIGRAHV